MTTASFRLYLSPEWSAILAAWISKSDELLQVKNVSFKEAQTLLQSLLLVSYDGQIPLLRSIVHSELKGQLDNMTAKAWEVFNKALDFLPLPDYRSESERKHIEDKPVPSTFTNNAYLYGFEADLIQRIDFHGKETIVYYEIDGVYYKQPPNILYIFVIIEMTIFGDEVIRKDISW